MARSSIPLGLVILMCSPAISAAFEGPPKGQAADDWPKEPAALLARLKERDTAFDNRSVETEQRWVEKVSPRAQIAANRFDARRFGQPDPGSPPDDKIPADFDQPHRLLRRLTVREPAVTIERLNDLEEMKHPEYVAIPNRGCRWSSAGGVERVWSPDSESRKGDLAFWHGHHQALPDRPDQRRMGPGRPRHPGPEEGRPPRQVSTP